MTNRSPFGVWPLVAAAWLGALAVAAAHAAGALGSHVTGRLRVEQALAVETLSAPLDGGSGGISVGPDGRIYVADFGEMLDGSGRPGTRLFVVEPDGRSSVFAEGFRGASGNEMGPDGILYQSNIGGHYISKVYPDGRNEPWVSDGIRAPVGIVMDGAGHLVVANCGDGSLQRVGLDGTSTRLAAGDPLDCPNGVTMDDDGVFYVANFGNGDVVRVTPEGEARVLATIPGDNNGHLTYHDGRLYVVARSAHQIYTVSLDGEVALLAGAGRQGLDDGPALEATFSYPNDIGVSPDGRYLYVNDVADLSSTGRLLAPMVVRRISLDGAPDPDPNPDADVAALIATIEAPQVPDRQGLDSLAIDELMDRFGVPGVSVAVIHDFEVHWAKGYGVADVETGAPVDERTLFQAASISKPVAAMATLDVAHDGRFGLDDDINAILTSWTLPASEFTRRQPVTPRGLLSHTAGTGDGFGFPGYAPGEPTPTLVQILDGAPPSNVGPVRIVRRPLTSFHYSGGGVTLMQLALTDALGRPFAAILDDVVLGPAGMTDSTFAQPLSPDRDAGAARAHDGRGGSMGPKWHVYPEQAAAGLWTTPTDLARLAVDVQRAIQGDTDRVLSPTMAQLMLSPVGVGDYGLGFAVTKRGQGWYFGHGGSNWGFRARLLAHKLKGYGVAIMTNGQRGGAVIDELIARIERAYGWDSLDKGVVR